MHRLASFAQIKHYRPVPLKSEQHNELAKVLRLFSPDKERKQLSFSYLFPQEKFQVTLQKMNRIGLVADAIDHHPEWTLTHNRLTIKLSTHQIGNNVSEKDYIFAHFAEEVLLEEELEATLIASWNKLAFQY